MFRPFPLLVLALAGCSDPTATVRVSIPDLYGVETPLAELIVTFLPYDRDSVIEVLEGRMGAPRPHTARLDSLFGIFRDPFQRYLVLADSATRRADDPDLAARAETARLGLVRVREQVGPEILRLRTATAAWEDSAYREYRAFTRALSDRIFATPVADTTDALGWAGATLTDGRWWVTARSPDPTDPNREWYWNLPVTRDTVFLDPRTGRNRPRY